MLLATLLGCLPLPFPDYRRPASLVNFEGAEAPPPGVTVRACTWSMHHPVALGCDEIAEGEPSRDGVGVSEWTGFPLVLRTSTPLWADAFVACEGGKPRGITLRLPDLQVKHNAAVSIVLDGPPTKWGANARHDVSDADANALAAALCAGTQPLRVD